MTEQQELELDDRVRSGVEVPEPPAQRNRSTAEISEPAVEWPEVPVASRPLLGVQSSQGYSAWMIVPPVDAAMLLLPLFWSADHAKAILLMAAVSVTLLFGAGRYRARLHLSVLDELPTLLGRLLTAGAVVATLFALINNQAEVASFLGLLLVTIGLVLLGRLATTMLILTARKRRVVAHRTIIVGGGVRAAEMATLLCRYPQYGLVPVGFVDDSQDCEAGRVATRLGRVRDLEILVPATGADVLLVADGDLAETELLDIVRSPDCQDCDLLVIPRLPQFHTQVGNVDHIGSVPVMRIRNPSLEGPSWAAKRAFDVIVSALALLFLAPVMAACALAVRLEGGPGVLFRQDRVGRHGQLFSCLKFRSMKRLFRNWSATEDMTGLGAGVVSLR